MAINKTLDIDISSQSAFIKIHIPQGDNIDRKYYINFLDGSNEFIIPSTAIVRFQMTKFNGTVIYNNCPVVNNQVEFDITPAISAESGRHPAQFKITDSFTGGELKSFKLHLLIEENVDIESVVVNTSEFTALQDMELRLGDADALLEAAIDNAGNAAENANSKATLAQIAATNANDKATYAQTKGDYANTKALEAENSATNANEKANYAQTKGDFAIEAGNRANEISNSVEAAEALRPKYIYLTRSEYDALPLFDKENRNKIYEITDDDGQLPNELSNLINDCQDATQAAWDASVGALPDIITPGTYNKVNVDSKGRVGSASLESKISELGVTDVYTKDDIDTKLGNINTEKLDIGNDYRPNIIFNGDFKLWSLGISFTCQGGATVVADKWLIATVSNTIAIISKDNAGMKIYSAQGATITLTQNLSSIEKISGKKCALTYCINGVLDTAIQTLATTSIEKWITLAAGETVIINWVKFEVNDHVTPFIPKSYKEELLNCSDNVGYAPNLLINGDFQIWQRGETFDHTSTSGRFYVADRWCVFRGGYGPGITTIREGNYLKLTNPNDGNYTILAQTFESNDVAKMAGKTVTVSCKVKASANVNITMKLWYSADGLAIPGYGGQTAVVDKTLQLNTGFSTYEATGIVPTNAKGLQVELAMGASATYWFEYVKLEVNDHATLFAPRPFIEELTLCQRYYYPLIGRTIRPFTYDANTFWAHQTIPSMRAAPTFIQGTKGTDWETYGNVNDPVAGVTAVLSGFYGDNNIVIAFSKPGHTLTMSNFYVSILTSKYALDAEI